MRNLQKRLRVKRRERTVVFFFSHKFSFRFYCWREKVAISFIKLTELVDITLGDWMVDLLWPTVTCEKQVYGSSTGVPVFPNQEGGGKGSSPLDFPSDPFNCTLSEDREVGTGVRGGWLHPFTTYCIHEDAYNCCEVTTGNEATLPQQVSNMTGQQVKVLFHWLLRCLSLILDWKGFMGTYIKLKAAALVCFTGRDILVAGCTEF